MKRTEPIHFLWWLVSRASGVLALILISLSVLMGLAMASKVLRGPRLKRAVARLHEHVALVALLAIAVHGLALLGDQWLKPGWRGIAVPFALGYRPQFTGLGIIAGYLALLLGPSFYLRRRIGARRWRSVHRATVVVWVLSAIHTIGAGSDGSKLWLRLMVLGSGVPIVYLFVLRLLRPRGHRTPQAARPGRAPAAGSPPAISPAYLRLERVPVRVGAERRVHARGLRRVRRNDQHRAWRNVE
jgi:sulfoxide reductase heme-binding subunit YedZ